MMQKNPMFDDIENEELEHINFLSNRYVVYSKVGEGTFSRVYKALDTRDGQYVGLKVITKTTSPNRVLEELTFLTILNGLNNCISLKRVIRQKDQIVAVFPYVEHTDFRDFISVATLFDIKNYMYNLLIAIKHVHECKIIHRDIKPGNFLYCKESCNGWLIDFGLAQHETTHKSDKDISNKENTKPVIFFNTIITRSKPPGYYERDTRPVMKAPRAGTRGFRAPEVILKYNLQTSAIDIWSAGVIFLSILSNQYPFFYSGDDVDALVEIATIFGHKEMRKISKKYNRIWKSNIDTIPEDKISFESIVKRCSGCKNYDADTYNLLERMLDMDCDTRVTADEALKHSFFDIIRNKKA